MNKEKIREYYNKFNKETFITELTIAYLLHEINPLNERDLSDKIIDRAYEIFGNYEYIFNENLKDDIENLKYEEEYEEEQEEEIDK